MLPEQTIRIFPSASFSEVQLAVNVVPAAELLLEGLKLHEGEPVGLGGFGGGGVVG